MVIMESSHSNQHAQLNASSTSPTRHNSRSSLSRQPSLLPAFEPLSSSPPVASNKRKFQDLDDLPKHYPTPIPTSSTGILPSSPPRRPGFQRTLSTLSERAPLGDLPSIVVPANGDLMRIGRSSNSSQYQLPYSRHISRVHVTARYERPSGSDTTGKIVVQCLGWNGAVIRCAGQQYELEKGDSWVSTRREAEIILDVLECRVMVQWPDVSFSRSRGSPSLEPWAEESPTRAYTHASNTVLPSSPPALLPRSPISASPAQMGLEIHEDTIPTSDTVQESHQTGVQVYEDQNSDHVHELSKSPSKSVRRVLQEKASSSSLSSDADGLSDQENENEENDPIVHSFGPFGSNLLSRLNSFSHASPRQPTPQHRKRPLKAASVSPKREPSASPARKTNVDVLAKIQESPIKNHVINQLAFSRVHAIPLSTIHSNLPAELRACSTLGDSTTVLPQNELELMLHSIPCVGEIKREGKDAAGKPLENEFYYLPEMDDNTMRRDAVLGGRGGTGLRAVRKNHKQYYWKKPRV